MKIFYFMSIAYIIIYFIYLGFLCFKNQKPNYLKLKILSAFFIIMVSILSSLIIPSENYDLYRHYNTIDLIRKYGFSVKTENDSFILIKLLFYFISLLKTNVLLQVISCLISYSIFYYILNDFSIRKNMSIKAYIFSILIMFCFTPFEIIYSGVRNSMAFAILALAIYREFIEHKKNFITYFLYILPVFIHFASLIIIGIRLIFCIYKKFYKYRLLLLLWSICLGGLSKIFIKSNIKYISKLGSQVKYYIGGYSGDIKIFIIYLFMAIFILILLQFIFKSEKKLEKEDSLLLIELILIISLGSLCAPEIFKRMLYILGYLSPIIGYTLFKYLKGNRLIIKTIFSICFMLNFLYQYIGMVSNGLKLKI